MDSCALPVLPALLQLNVEQMAKENPHDIGRLLDSTVLSLARKVSGNISRWGGSCLSPACLLACLLACIGPCCLTSSEGESAAAVLAPTGRCLRENRDSTWLEQE